MNPDRPTRRVVFTHETLSMADQMALQDAESGTTPDRSALVRKLVRQEWERRTMRMVAKSGQKPRRA